jgi:hypothetical protein
MCDCQRLHCGDFSCIEVSVWEACGWRAQVFAVGWMTHISRTDAYRFFNATEICCNRNMEGRSSVATSQSQLSKS